MFDLQCRYWYVRGIVLSLALTGSDTGIKVSIFVDLVTVGPSSIGKMLYYEKRGNKICCFVY